MAKNYREIFFVYCVPGLLLIIIGVLIGRADLPHLGVALLSLGMVHYGKTKGYRRLWTAIWVILCVVYLLLGSIELVNLARRSL